MKNKTDNYNDLLDKKRNEKNTSYRSYSHEFRLYLFVGMNIPSKPMYSWYFCRKLCGKKKMSLFIFKIRFSQIQYAIMAQLPEE